MRIVDANLLIYANDSASPFHQRAKEWWDQVLSGTEDVGLPWMTLNAVLRLVTHPRLCQNPLSPQEAWSLAASWLAQPCVSLIEPTEAYAGIYRKLACEHLAVGNLMMDAALAAFALERGAELHSADGDFARFRGLRWVNPLAE